MAKRKKILNDERKIIFVVFFFVVNSFSLFLNKNTRLSNVLLFLLNK